jgi:hypothetical protein
MQTQEFQIGQLVTFVVRPTTPAQIHDILYDTKGVLLYYLTYVDGDDIIREGKFYAFELEARDE